MKNIPYADKKSDKKDEEEINRQEKKEKLHNNYIIKIILLIDKMKICEKELNTPKYITHFR